MTGLGITKRPAPFVTRQVKSVVRPTVAFAETEIHQYNSIMYIPQKPKWSAIDIVFLDDIGSHISTTINNQVQYQQNFLNMTSTTAGISYKFQTYIETLDGGDDNVLESWFLEGCYIQSVAYDTFDYSSSEPMQLTVNLRFDNAQQDTALFGNTADNKYYEMAG